MRPSGAPYFPERPCALISGGRIRKLPPTAQRRILCSVAPTLMGLTGKPFRDSVRLSFLRSSLSHSIPDAVSQHRPRVSQHRGLPAPVEVERTRRTFHPIRSARRSVARTPWTGFTPACATTAFFRRSVVVALTPKRQSASDRNARFVPLLLFLDLQVFASEPPSSWMSASRRTLRFVQL